MRRQALDKAEGVGIGYEAKNGEVTFMGTPRMASIYHATAIDPSLKPYSWYKALVVAGAKEHNLPERYVERLLATVALEDPDRERHARNWLLPAADRSGRPVMKLHFEPNLDYQLQAIEAVCGLFHGQETCRTEFTVTRDAASGQISLLGKRPRHR